MAPQPTRIVELPLDTIVVGRRFRRDVGEVDALAASIAQLGLLQPIIVTAEHRLVAGARRLEACRRLGMQTIMCIVPPAYLDLWAQLVAEAHENTCRKSFTPGEAAAAAETLLPYAREAAKERQLGASEKSSEGGEALTQVAKIVGMSRPTLQQAMKVAAAAREDPAAFNDLLDQMNRTGKIAGPYNELLRRQSGARSGPTPGLTIRIDARNQIKVANIRNRPALIANLYSLINQLRQELPNANEQPKP